MTRGGATRMKGKPPTATLVLVHGTLEVEPPWPEGLLARKGLTMKRDVMMLAGALLAGLVGGVVSSRVLMSTPIFAQKTPQQERVIRAERFELVSKEGKTRAVLGERTLGLSAEDLGLSLTEEEKKEGEKPFPGLFLVDEEGKTRAVFGMRVTGPGLLLLT